MATLIFLAGAGYVYYQHHKASKNFELEEGLSFDGKETVQFLPSEHGIPKHSLSAVTFFEGNYKEIAPLLEARVEKIRKYNPWLGGFLAPPQNGSTSRNGLQLWYDTEGKGSRTSFRCYPPGDIPLTQLTPYERYHAICKNHDIKVPSTDELVGKNIPLFQVHLIPDAQYPKDKFILVVSMATLLGDSHTFYALFNQISLSMSVVSLNPLRKEDYLAEALEHCGEEEIQYLNKIGESDSPLKALFSSFDDDDEEEEDSSPEILVFRVSTKWMEQQRELHPSVGEDGCYIISWFFRLLQPEVGLLSNSLRGFLPSVGELDAGNYQSPVPLIEPDYNLPQHIETCLKTGRRHSKGKTQLPKRPESFGVAVDWARLGGTIQRFDIDKDGASSLVEQTNHFPLMDTQDLQVLPKGVSGLVVFLGTSDQLGAMCIVPKETVDDIHDSGIMDAEEEGTTYASLSRQGGSLKVAHIPRGGLLRQSGSHEL